MAPRTLDIGRIVANARLFNPRSAGGPLVSERDLLVAVERLFELLAERKVDFLLVGGIALLQYVEGRNTEDIDLIVALPALDQVPELRVSHREGHFLRSGFEGVQVDLLLTTNTLFEKVRREHSAVRHFVGRDIPCATVEGLVLLKLYALPSLYREGNFARVGLYENDIATLLHEYRPDLEPIWAELAKHLPPSDLEQVREIHADLERRLARFGRG